MSSETTSYPYGYCGMTCTLCTRYRVDGASKCPGCSCDGYYTVMCKVHHCCREKGLIHCGYCEDFPCERLGKMGEFSNLSTDHVKERTCSAVKADGFSKWYEDYTERTELLTSALEKYNDGRMKRFLCELFIQRDIKILRKIMCQAEMSIDSNLAPKEKGMAFRGIADSMLSYVTEAAD